MVKFENGKLYLPEGLKILAEDFDIGVDKKGVKEIYLPDSARALAYNAISNYENLEHIYLNDGLMIIGKNAFVNCPKLKELNFPKTITKFDWPTINRCGSLEKITIEESELFSDKGCNCVYYKPYNRVLIGCKNTIIPEGTKDIYGTFCNVKGLNEVIIPEGVEKLRGEAFSYSDVKRIVIPKSLVNIRNFAFFSCQDLKEIVVHKDNPKYMSVNGNLLVDKVDKRVLFASLDAKIPEGVEQTLPQLHHFKLRACLDFKNVSNM